MRGPIRSEDDRRRPTIGLVLAIFLAPTLAQAQVPAIVSDKTVGTDPFTCATTDSLLLPPGGGLVTYSFEVTNTGGVTFTSLDLVDSELGALLTAQPFVLPPGTSTIVTQTVALNATTMNMATWTASITPTIAVSDEQSALVTVAGPNPAIVSSKTVGTDPFTCATTDSILLPPGGGQVTYCFEVTNTGGVTFTSLDLVDSELGALLTAQPFVLPPATSTIVTQTVALNTTTMNTATWTASITPTIAVSDEQSALVTVAGQNPAIVSNKTVGTDPFTCATTDSIVLPPGGGLVTYCFEVTNTGGVTFTSLDLVDSELGALLTAQPFVLPPATSTIVTQTVPLAATTLNFATWTASITPTIAVSDVQSALVTVQGSPGPTVGIPTLSAPTLLLLALLLCGAGLVAVRRLS